MNKVLLILTLFTFKQSAAQHDTATVHFDFDKHQLRTNAIGTLNKILTSKNILSISLYGHCDQLGTNSYNEKLSEKRANAVKQYFLDNGLSAEKISVVKGYGETMPVIDQLDENSRQQNRRVVIVVEYATEADNIPVQSSPPAPIDTSSAPTKVKPGLTDKIKDSTTKQGQNIVLKNINFYGGRHFFLPESYPALAELLDAMQNIPTLEIEIQGHICCRDDSGDGDDLDTGERRLSHNRARAVFEWLVKNGIDAKRMSYKGYGHQFPLVDVERTEEERTMNRRVEIKILKK